MRKYRGLALSPLFYVLLKQPRVCHAERSESSQPVRWQADLTV